MNKLYKFTLVFLLASQLNRLNSKEQEDLSQLSNQDNIYLLDKTLATIYHPEEKVVITKSDLRPHLDGRPKELKEVVQKELIILDAKGLKFDQRVTDQDVDKVLENLQKEHNMTREQLEDVFKSLGYDWEQGRQELKKIQLSDTMMHYRIKDKIFVEKSEIEKFYKDNPIYKGGSLKLQKTEIPFYETDSSSREEKLAKIDKFIKDGTIVDKVTWDEQLEVEPGDLSEDKQFINDLPVDSVVKLKVDTEGISLLHIKEKSSRDLVTLEDREQEIASTLRKEKYERAVTEYEKELNKQANVVYNI